ncbi:hypothetical protein BUALT_Bualt06G0124700 [Buddleja alternifolia]|uniref:AT-hook motif nuclear-localized protein n=1 Tax=Buddleja alternifolia TaxID=168488 RepID=A0AAV6XR03_9LAMI|nr:hypothetical protein BUALT_Bualt06G0124700 [Buddleja alternifolia]
MEEKDGLNGTGVEPRVENSGQNGGSAPPETVAPVTAAAGTAEVNKKKRGRPRKYAGDGSVVALSPMPISASIPLAGSDYSAWKQSSGKPIGSLKKKHKLEFEIPGRTAPYSASGSFTPHVITVNTGEDIMMKIISFSQQGSRAICILAANGVISNVTLRQPNSSGGTLTYEGRFEILSLTGSFMLSDNGLTKSRSGGMSVSLAGPDGRVLGGGLAGMLVAAGPVQVVIGSFLPENQQPLEQKPKKPKYERNIAFAPIPATPVSEQRYEASVYTGPKPNFSTSTFFHGDNNLASINSMHGSKITGLENNVSLPGEDSREPSHELTC